MDGGLDGCLTADLCSLSGVDWAPLRYTPLDFGLETRPLYLDRHLVAIRWLGDHAICTNFDVW